MGCHKHWRNQISECAVWGKYCLEELWFVRYFQTFLRHISGGAWVAQSVQSVKHPTSTQVMISWSVGSSLASGPVLTAQSLEPLSGSVSPSLSAPPMLMLSLCLSIVNKH